MSGKTNLLRCLGMLYCICLVQAFFFTNLTEHDWPRYGKREQSLEQRNYKQRLGLRGYTRESSYNKGNTERFSYIPKSKMRALANDETDSRLTGDEMQQLRSFIQTLWFNVAQEPDEVY